MANWAALKAAVSEVIKTNGNEEITGALLQSILNSIISNLGENYQFIGIATPSTTPGTPDANVFYLAETAGTYANFGGITISNGEVAMLKYNGGWSKEVTGYALNGGTTKTLKEIEDIAISADEKADGKVSSQLIQETVEENTWYVTDGSGKEIAKIDAAGLHIIDVNIYNGLNISHTLNTAFLTNLINSISLNRMIISSIRKSLRNPETLSN